MKIASFRAQWRVLGKLFVAMTLLATSPATAADPGRLTFDGITIIEFEQRAHIVAFVTARGSYVSFVPYSYDPTPLCQAIAVAGSHKDGAISFGLAADISVRRQGIRTVCPLFSLRFEDATTVRVAGTAPNGQPIDESRKVVARIPFNTPDFNLPHFTRHDVKGVKIGPFAASGDELGRIGQRTIGASASKWLNRPVASPQARRPSSVQGRVAAAEITGWRSDILFFARYIEEFKQVSTAQAFKEAALERYGTPAAEFENVGYMVWIYDLDGRLLAGDDRSNSCRRTLDFWARDPPMPANGLIINFEGHDLGAWGCSLAMELRTNRVSGGVSGYMVQVTSGYVLAINHFQQRILDATEITEKAQGLASRKPRL